MSLPFMVGNVNTVLYYLQIMLIYYTINPSLCTPCTHQSTSSSAIHCFPNEK